MRHQHAGVLSATAGLSGHGDDVVAFSTAGVPGWIVAIERPSSTVFAPARHAFVLGLASVAGALIVVFAAVAFVLWRARRESARQSGRTRAWTRLTRTLAATTTPKDVADAMLASLVGVFPDAVSVVALDGASGGIVQASSRARSVPGLDRATLERIAEVGRERPRSLIERDPARGGGLGRLGRRYRALHAVPVGGGPGGSLGTISILSPATELDPDDWSLLESFADLAESALKRAHLFEREHELATRLQRSLLPDRLPSPEGVVLAGHYHAGGPAVEIGGDWYDAVRRPDGIVQLCVGDVSGRGIGAATVMGRHRNTFHAYAYECVSPAQIIRRMLRHVQGDQMITVAVVSVDPYTGEIAYSCAGHPPPLLVDQGTRKVRRLDDASAPPIGVADASEVAEGRLQLAGPATLALYTDGLIERRGLGLDEAIDLLGDALASVDRATPDDVLEQIAAEIGPPVDDVALLIAALEEAAELEIELPALPAALPELRRRLRMWLGRHGVVGDELAEVVLAVSEACNNAIEHAYTDREGTLRVRIVADGRLLRIVVEDQGRWRDARPGDERGRGILLMRNLMHSAKIETGPAGTQVRLERRRGGRGSDSELAPTGSPP
jgi:anti-sigma regulatory factor (Ser/Thr protein kinase)